MQSYPDEKVTQAFKTLSALNKMKLLFILRAVEQSVVLENALEDHDAEVTVDLGLLKDDDDDVQASPAIKTILKVPSKLVANVTWEDTSFWDIAQLTENTQTLSSTVDTLVNRLVDIMHSLQAQDADLGPKTEDEAADAFFVPDKRTEAARQQSRQQWLNQLEDFPNTNPGLSAERIEAMQKLRESLHENAYIMEPAYQDALANEAGETDADAVGPAVLKLTIHRLKQQAARLEDQCEEKDREIENLRRALNREEEVSATHARHFDELNAKHERLSSAILTVIIGGNPTRADGQTQSKWIAGELTAIFGQEIMDEVRALR